MKTNRITRKVLALLLAMLMVLGTAACGSDGNNSGDPERKNASDIVADNKAQTETKTPESTPQTDSGSKETSAETDAQTQAQTDASKTGEKKTEYPVTITTYGSDGAQIQTVYEKAPGKVVAVYQGSIETMLALGLEDHLVATAGLDNEVPDDQKAAFSKTNYLDEFTPSLETVTMLEPDMIFSWGSLFGEKTLGEAQSWIDRGVNTYINSNTRATRSDGNNDRTLENEYTDILNIGKIFDVQGKAEAIVQDMKDTITKVLDKTSEMTDKPTVLILESYKDSYSNYGATSLGGDMVTQLGGVLANPDASSLGKEDVIVANPDVIFVVYMPYSGDDPEQVKQDKLKVFLEDEAFASLDAVKNGRVVPIMLSEMYASATRTKDGIVTFANGLYPDVDLGISE